MSERTLDVKLTVGILMSLDRKGKLRIEVRTLAKKETNKQVLWYNIVSTLRSETASLLSLCRETMYRSMWDLVERIFLDKINWNDTAEEYLRRIGFDMSKVEPGYTPFKVPDEYELDLSVAKGTLQYAKKLIKGGATKAEMGEKVRKLVYATLLDFFKSIELYNYRELVYDFLDMVNWKRVEDFLWKNAR